VFSRLLTVSGISSGGYMAVQFHVAFSSSVSGAGIVAGGPYWCSQGNVAVALSECMRDPSMISLDELYAATDYAAALKSIDPTSNLNGDQVYLFSGTQDQVVYPGVMRKLQEYYEHYISSDDIVANFNLTCVHGMITNDWGSPCMQFGSPYINNCSFDLAGALLDQLYGPLKPAVAAVADNLEMLKQSDFTPGHVPPQSFSMGPTAYVYYPSACSQAPPSNCSRVHVAFHGCLQNIALIGDDYYTHAGYNSWAEANDIIVVYPQVQKTDGLNPEGCWDWWGYAGADFATKFGLQMATVNNIVQAL